MMRQVLDGLLPTGSAWRPARGGSLDQFLNAVSDNWDAPKAFLATLATIRDPLKTPYLSDLERDFGITPNVFLPESRRRLQLLVAKTKRRRTGGASDLQAALDLAGFGVGGYGLQVFANDPAVDPRPFLNNQFQMYLGGPNSTVGWATAFLSQLGAQLIVNGDRYTYPPAYQALGTFQLAQATATIGYYNKFYTIPTANTIPADSTLWPLVFFVAQSVTRDGSGYISALSFAGIPQNRRNDLMEIVLKFKPMHTWCVAAINWI